MGLGSAERTLNWVESTPHASHADQKREHVEAMARLQAEYDRIANRVF